MSATILMREDHAERTMFHNHFRPSHTTTRLAIDRLNALTDGVLGFAMTLLVLNVDIPEKHVFTADGVLLFFRELEHDAVIYAASFFLIARYWIEHHLIFHCIRYVNRVLVWLNFVFMFFITMVPIATKLKGTYEQEAFVAAIFGIVHIFCWLSLLGVWRYTVSQSDLLQSFVEPKIISQINRRLIFGPIVILAAIGLSFVNIRLGNFAFLVIPIVYLFQPRIDLNPKDGNELENA